jgi:peptide/nickel transport system permease protein
MEKEKAHFWYTVNGRMLRAAWKRPEFKFGLFVFVFLLLLALILPALSDVSATKISVRDRFLPPVLMGGGNSRYFFGTDQLGRDLLLRSLIGLQNALLIGILSVLGMFCLGAAVGIVSGYRGGFIDTLLMRITDAQMSIPVVILAITILGVSRPTPFSVIIVLILAGWPTYARVTRSATLSESKKEYVRAAKIIGASNPRIMARHIAPNILPPVAFIGVLDVARMMIFEAIFGFIGIGIQPPTPTFGNILADGTKYLINAWWITVIPGLFLFAALLSLNFIGNALEKARNDVMGGHS